MKRGESTIAIANALRTGLSTRTAGWRGYVTPLLQLASGGGHF